MTTGSWTTRQGRRIRNCKELIPGYLDGVTGEYATPKGYFVDEEAAERFDKQFPHKEKLSFPGHLF